MGVIFIRFYIVVSKSEAEKSNDDNKLKHEMASKGHSRSSVLGSLEARQGTS